MSRRFAGAGLRRNVRMQGARRSGAAPFTPADIAGLEAWYRGDEDDTVDIGGGVATLIDKSGNGRDLTQATATSRPTPVMRAGQRALSFDGGDLLQGAFGSTLAQPVTIYGVWEVASTASQQVIFDGDDATNRHFLYIHNTGPTLRAGAPSEIVGGVPVAAQITASAFVANGVSSALYGISNFATPGATGDAGAAAIDGFTLGATSGGLIRLTGYIWETLIYSGAHSADARAAIAAYLTARYEGLTVTA